MRRKRPDEASSGMVTSVVVATGGTGPARPAHGRAGGRQALDGGAIVAVVAIDTAEDGRMTAAGRFRLP